eukprot:7381524-Prymnesium_polylepis.2
MSKFASHLRTSDGSTCDLRVEKTWARHCKDQGEGVARVNGADAPECPCVGSESVGDEQAHQRQSQCPGLEVREGRLDLKLAKVLRERRCCIYNFSQPNPWDVLNPAVNKPESSIIWYTEDQHDCVGKEMPGENGLLLRAWHIPLVSPTSIAFDFGGHRVGSQKAAEQVHDIAQSISRME